MKKIIKPLIILIVVGTIVILIGRVFYQVLCISCTTPPLKTYSYSGSMDQLENHFKGFATANPIIDCKISHRGADSIAAKDSVPASIIAIAARDVIIKQKINGRDMEYDLVIYDFNGSTKLDLDAIFNETHKNSGDNADDKNVKTLLSEFENSFLARFQKDQHIKLRSGLFNLN